MQICIIFYQLKETKLVSSELEDLFHGTFLSVGQLKRIKYKRIEAISIKQVINLWLGL